MMENPITPDLLPLLQNGREAERGTGNTLYTVKQWYCKQLPEHTVKQCALSHVQTVALCSVQGQ